MSRIERMRRGDRAALREVLQEHGAALARFVATMGDRNVDDAIVAAWKATVVAPADLDERAFLLTRAAAATAEPRTSRVPDTDVVDYVRLVAEVATGLGDDLDRERLAEQVVDDGLRELRAQIERTIADSIGEDGPLPELDAVWARIEPRLT